MFIDTFDIDANKDGDINRKELEIILASRSTDKEVYSNVFKFVIEKFEEIDTDGDGFLSLKELRKGNIPGGRNNTPMVRKLDSNDDKLISREELRVAIKN